MEIAAHTSYHLQAVWFSLAGLCQLLTHQHSCGCAGKQSKASKVPRPSAAAPSLAEDLPTIEEAHPSSQALADNGLEASAAADDDGMEAGIDTSDRDPDSNDATDDLKLPISHQVSLQGELI